MFLLLWLLDVAVKGSIYQYSVAVVTVAGFCGLCRIKGAVSSETCVLGGLCSGLEGSVFVVGMRVHLGNLFVKECGWGTKLTTFLWLCGC